MNTFHLQIVTPDGIFYDGEAARVKVRGANGDLAILYGHTDFVTSLGSGVAKVFMENGEVRRAACSGGMISVNKNTTRVIATTFEWEEDIDFTRAEKAKAKAEENLSKAQDNLERDLAKAKLMRALTRISLSDHKI